MSNRFTAINLTGLNPPDIVEALDYETILAAMKADYTARMHAAGFDFDVGMLESEPSVKVLETASYHDLLLRARVNGSARAIMLAYAQKNDLDQIGAYYSVERQLVTPATETTPAVYEEDARFRTRVQLAPEAFSTAGPPGAYLFHVLTLNPKIKDCGVYSPSPGTVEILPLMYASDGMPDNTLLEAVRVRLTDHKIKPLTDVLSIHKPALNAYTIDVTLKLADGPDPTTISNTARASLQKYTYDRNIVGADIYVAGVVAAAKVDGVENVYVALPTADISPGPGGVGYCSDINIAIA